VLQVKPWQTKSLKSSLEVCNYYRPLLRQQPQRWSLEALKPLYSTSFLIGLEIITLELEKRQKKYCFKCLDISPLELILSAIILLKDKLKNQLKIQSNIF
jgi:hypothetical protein